MITLAELKERIRIADYRLKTLNESREQHATEGDWSVVKAIKEQEARIRAEKKTLESVMTPEDFMDN